MSVTELPPTAPSMRQGTPDEQVLTAGNPLPHDGQSAGPSRHARSGRPTARRARRLALNAELDTVDISGRGFSATKKFRNAKANPRVTFLIDEVLPPWRPRAVMIQGLATTIEGGADREAMIRITPQGVISWGLDDIG